MEMFTTNPITGETFYHGFNNTTTNKEEKNMAGAVEITQIDVNGVRYTNTRPNYYYKKVDGKQVRISKAEWEQAFEQYIQTADDNADVDGWDAEDEINERKAKQDESDKMAEDTVNGKKTVKKGSRSKNIAFTTTIQLADDKIADVTLTAKQVKFIKLMPEDDFYKHGLESTLWIDVFCDTIADEFNPMAVGAMVSTLREKDLIYVSKERVNGRINKFFGFTELGRAVAKELGLN